MSSVSPSRSGARPPPPPPTPPLLTRWDVPPIFREPYIVTGYRNPCSSARQCVWSVLEATNETFNCWTHVASTLYFLLLAATTWRQHSLHDCAMGYPLAVLLVAICLYPLMSASAHVFNTMSVKARHLCFFLDYAALSVYSLAVAIAYKAYLFPRELIGTSYCTWYVPIATVNALGCMLFSCQTRFMRQGVVRKILRFMAFAIPYLFDTLPLLYRLLYSADAAEESNSYHARQVALASLGTFFYVSHVPERWFPGTFDVIGHSHQWFHILTSIASHDQVLGLTMDYVKTRDLASLANRNIPSFSTSVALVSGVFLINMLILIGYTIWMYNADAANHPALQETGYQKKTRAAAQGGATASVKPCITNQTNGVASGRREHNNNTKRDRLSSSSSRDDSARPRLRGTASNGTQAQQAPTDRDGSGSRGATSASPRKAKLL